MANTRVSCTYAAAGARARSFKLKRCLGVDRWVIFTCCRNGCQNAKDGVPVGDVGSHRGLRYTQGGGNPFDMKNLMESVKKAQQMVQTETARVQTELAK